MKLPKREYFAGQQQLGQLGDLVDFEFNSIRNRNSECTRERGRGMRRYLVGGRGQKASRQPHRKI